MLAGMRRLPPNDAAFFNLCDDGQEVVTSCNLSNALNSRENLYLNIKATLRTLNDV